MTSLFVPLLVLGVYLETKIIAGHDSLETKAFDGSGKVRCVREEKD